MNRAKVLLQAAFDLLNKQQNSHYVLNLLEETVVYDEANCDGHCLMDDIKNELEEFDREEMESMIGMLRVLIKRTEPKQKRTNKKKKIEYPPEFMKIWLLYPSRGGASNPKNHAYASFNARLKEVLPGLREEIYGFMLKGTERYAKFCEATGKTNTETVMQAKRFFGTSKEYLNSWAIPKPKRLMVPYGKEAMVDFAREHDLPEATTEPSYDDYRRKLQRMIDAKTGW